MRRLWLVSLACAVCALPAAGTAAEIHGDYVEARSADVWTGPCFANGETGLLGQEAILAWRVSRGSFGGVSLDGLSVVGVVKASATLGDPFADPYPAKAVLIVDAKATPAQRAALEGLARDMGGRLFDNVLKTEVAPIRLELRHGAGHDAQAVLEAGDLASVETRTVGEMDKHCGNEDVYYPPLARTTHAMPAVSIVDTYRGKDLGVTWSTHDKRNAFVGSFAR
jgi:hypothetical protein